MTPESDNVHNARMTPSAEYLLIRRPRWLRLYVRRSCGYGGGHIRVRISRSAVVQEIMITVRTSPVSATRRCSAIQILLRRILLIHLLRSA